MTLTTSFNPTGVAATLKELGQIDPQLAKAAKARIKEAASPLVSTARGFIPTDSPLSGMTRSKRLGWQSGSVRSGISAKVSTKPARSGRIPLLSVIQKNPAGAMWDMAGRASGGATPQGRAMIRNLAGQPSRSMWPAAEQAIPTVEENLRIAVRDLEDTMDLLLGKAR